MRKYAIRILVSGSIAVSFMLLLLALAIFDSITTITIGACLSGTTLSIAVSFQALWQLAKNGHIMTPVPQLLRM